jgi:hypothetical protein
MNHLQRAALLFEEAKRDNLDSPTEEMVGDAIHSACEDTKTDCIMALRANGMGRGADYLERLQTRMHRKSEDA